MTDKLTPPTQPVLILASASPRRAELLNSAGIPHLIQPADIDESRAGEEPPEGYVLRLSREKALAVAQTLMEPRTVLGADTIVVIGPEVVGKPVDASDAARMLRALSGTWHEVLTGVTLVAGERLRSEVAKTRVRFVEMNSREIDWYISTGEPFDKAGAYAIQGFASRFVAEIDGSYSNVVGLPIQTVYRIASELGVELM
jgi:septum formation protein